MTTLISISAWILLGLPPACGYLAFSLARDRGTPSGRRKVWLWLCLTILFLCAIFLGMEASGRAFAATDCTGGTTFLGCDTSDPRWGNMLFSVFWRLTLFLPVVGILTLLLLLATALRLRRPLS